MKYSPLTLLALALPCVLAAPGNNPNAVRQAPTPVNPAATTTPSPFVCGVQGYASGAYYVTSGNLATFDECRQFCLGASYCKSFAIMSSGPNGSTGCAVWSSQVWGTMTAMGSVWTFYDLACPSATTTINPYAPPPSPTRTPPTYTPVCGLHSWSGSTNAYVYDPSGQNGTPALCSAKCQQEYRCYSFAVVSGGHTCMLFTVGVASNTPQGNVPDSPYTFYDVHCPNPS